MPAPGDSRNFRLFSEVVPANTAKLDSSAHGKWLSLSVCYAEMVGARLNVPMEPSLDVHVIKAPPPILHISVNGKEHEVRFADPVSQSEFRLWDITYDEAGRVSSVSTDTHSSGAPVVMRPTQVAPKQMPQAPDPPEKQMPQSSAVARPI